MLASLRTAPGVCAPKLGAMAIATAARSVRFLEICCSDGQSRTVSASLCFLCLRMFGTSSQELSLPLLTISRCSLFLLSRLFFPLSLSLYLSLFCSFVSSPSWALLIPVHRAPRGSPLLSGCPYHFGGCFAFLPPTRTQNPSHNGMPPETKYRNSQDTFKAAELEELLGSRLAPPLLCD